MKVTAAEKAHINRKASYHLFIHSFIHSFIQANSIAPLQVLYYSEALPTQNGYCVEAPQTIASEGLVQCLYVAARAGFEPATLRMKGAESTNEPQRPTLKALNIYVFREVL